MKSSRGSPLYISTPGKIQAFSPHCNKYTEQAQRQRGRCFLSRGLVQHGEGGSPAPEGLGSSTMTTTPTRLHTPPGLQPSTAWKYGSSQTNDKAAMRTKTTQDGNLTTCFSVLSKYQVFWIQCRRCASMCSFFSVVCHVEWNASLPLRFVQDFVHCVEQGHGVIHFQHRILVQLQEKHKRAFCPKSSRQLSPEALCDCFLFQKKLEMNVPIFAISVLCAGQKYKENRKIAWIAFLQLAEFVDHYFTHLHWDLGLDWGFLPFCWELGTLESHPFRPDW